MVLYRKRLPAGQYDRLADWYMSKQKQERFVRDIREQNYVWIQGIGEENCDSDEGTKKQTSEKGR